MIEMYTGISISRSPQKHYALIRLYGHSWSNETLSAMSPALSQNLAWEDMAENLKSRIRFFQ